MLSDRRSLPKFGMYQEWASVQYFYVFVNRYLFNTAHKLAMKELFGSSTSASETTSEEEQASWTSTSPAERAKVYGRFVVECAAQNV